MNDKRFMLCHDGTGLTEKILDCNQWNLEEKLDGERCQLFYDDGKVNLINRHGNNITAQFPELADIKVASRQLVLDGEIIIPANINLKHRPSTSGRTIMGHDKISIASKVSPAKFMAFDCLEIDNQNLRLKKYEERKEILSASFIQSTTIQAVMPLNIDISPQELWQDVQARGLEGLVAKRKGSIYVGRRCSDWLKLKTWHEEDFNVIGFTSESREISALILEGGYKVNFGLDEVSYNHYLPLIKSNPKAFRVKVRYLTKHNSSLRFPTISEIVYTH